MIGPVTVRVSAAHPDVPLREVPVFQGSACSVGVLDVPAYFGGVSITGVEVALEGANGAAEAVSAVRAGGMWVATFSSAAASVPGRVKNGLTVTLAGKDEQGVARSWVVGKGDVEIISAASVPVAGEVWQHVRYLDEEPSSPRKGDLAKIGGAWKLYNGTRWETLGGGGGSTVVESDDNPGYAANADHANAASSAGSVPWSGISNKPSSFAPSAHAASHASGGPDEITPSAIGALPLTGGVISGNVTMYGQSGPLHLEVGAGGYGGSVSVDDGIGHPASIKKGGHEVATEDQVGAAKDELNARIDLIEATTKPNMNIVGIPKFNQGVVSGFSANDYLMFPTQVNVGQNMVEFYMSFTTGADVTTQQNLLDSWCGLAVAIKNGRFILAASSDGTSFVQNQSDAVVNHNTSYNVSVRFVNPAQGVYLVKLSDEDAMDDLATVELSAPLFPTATYWGGANPQSGVNHIFSGTINLNECRMVWNGAEVWRGYDELPTVKFDPTATPRLDTAEKIASQSAYPMAAVVGGALEDRTINHATAGGSFTFPVRTGTNARDFVLVIDSLATAPTVTFPGTVTYVSDQDAADVWTAEAGKTNAWYFSEVTDGVFMVSHKALAAVAQ